MKEKLTEKRKKEHIEIVLNEDIEEGWNGLQDVVLVHNALPELDFDEIDTSVEFLGKRLRMPLLISAMTGGTEEGKRINKALARVAEKKGIGMGVGSQRIAIEKPETIETFYVRDEAPNILLLGNIGVTKLRDYGVEKVEEVVEKIEADGIAVHLNVAQELFQKEREFDVNWKGCLKSIEELCKKAEFPVVAKEVGCGISREVAIKLKEAGVEAIDVAGWGGSNWVLIESLRSGKNVGEFRFWGIPTSCSILEVKDVGVKIIASGGIRTGLDIAKALALGAEVCAIAAPFLKILKKEGERGVERYIDRLLLDLKRAMMFTGCKNLEELRKAPYILKGFTKEWKKQRK